MRAGGAPAASGTLAWQSPSRTGSPQPQPQTRCGLTERARIVTKDKRDQHARRDGREPRHSFTDGWLVTAGPVTV